MVCYSSDASRSLDVSEPLTSANLTRKHSSMMLTARSLLYRGISLTELPRADPAFGGGGGGRKLFSNFSSRAMGVV